MSPFSSLWRSLTCIVRHSRSPLQRACLAVAVGCIASVAFGQRSTPLQLLHPAGAAIDQFGNAVAISGDTMVVGAPQDDVGAQADQGSAHILRWTGTGWTLEATITASDGLTVDRFGYSVAISGDTLVVGAYQDDVTATDQGSAYVFVRTPGTTTWTQQAKLVASDAGIGDQFGVSVTITGDSVIVGSHSDDVGANINQGSAYVFARAPGGVTWTQQAKVTASDGATNDFFGNAVAISGDTLLIGAYTDDNGANTDQGSAYVFVRSGAAWAQQAKLTASDGASSDGFGYSVAVSGDTALIGSFQDDVPAGGNAGSAYVFSRTGATWSQQAQLTASDGAASDFFGNAVAIDGNTALVGAYQDDTGANANQGAAYAYTRSGTTWTQQAKLTSPDGTASDNFGSGVALTGDTAVIGVNNDDVGANSNQGSAWVFSRIGSTWIGPDLTLLASDGAAGDAFGYSVSINGETALVGTPFATAQGAAYVFVRSGGIWTQQAKLTAADGANGDLFGVHVALSGDTALVSAYSDDIGANTNQGSAYVFIRSGSTWAQQAKLTASDGVAGALFGYSVGLSENTALIGARDQQVGTNNFQGAAYIFTRAGTNWTQQARLVAADGVAGDGLGGSAAIFGDTAVVGAFNDDVGANLNQGSVYIFARSGATWTQQTQLTASDGSAGDQFGADVAISGDTALVGASGDVVGANGGQGSAYVFARSGSAWEFRLIWSRPTVRRSIRSESASTFPVTPPSSGLRAMTSAPILAKARRMSSFDRARAGSSVPISSLSMARQTTISAAPSPSPAARPSSGFATMMSAH